MTVSFIIGAIVLLAGYDVYLVAKGQESISEVLRDGAMRYPIIAFLAGVLVGHWWWPIGCP